MYTRTVLLEMAVAIERSAKDFYSTLTIKFPVEKVLFNELAEDEEYPAKRYTELLAGEEDVYSSSEGRMLADYSIQVLEKTGIMNNLRRGSVRAQETQDLMSALDEAIQMERDSLLFYHSIELELGGKTIEEIRKIIRMEYDHLMKVVEKKSAIAS
jgi:rubrerythrin